MAYLYAVNTKIKSKPIIPDDVMQTPTTLSNLRMPILRFGGEAFSKPIYGAVAFDYETQVPFYSDGTTWKKISIPTSGSTIVESYNQVKNTDEIVPPRTSIILTGWNVSSCPAYHTTSNWNLSTGIFTADQPTTLSLTVKVTWSSGVSTIGVRIVQIIFYDASTNTATPVSTDKTQADPAREFDTTQELTAHLQLDTGDQVYVTAYHTARMDLIIKGSEAATSMSGYETTQL